MITKQFDYDKEEFWGQVYELALQGFSNRQIAIHLKTNDKSRFNPDTFNKMVRGTYEKWNNEDRQDYTFRLREILENAREKINTLVRSRYLKCGLGGHKVKTTTTVTKKIRVDNEETEGELIQTTVTESEMAPNPTILRHWLNMYDTDWAKQEEADLDDINPDNVKRGIDITSWLDKEMEEE